ncbi:probable carotenoid cleavage dioxygenase 4, chloroplastic [Cryptomeria japonica]|uniref:probable carotenoid cleavage dioxygenase 4, chloroplastic n=1 Tax=Cryptomeria japonica TaxID=3369 RepID=UPI0027DA2E66|nr:probable carotenoid cleavage dioxygenase 4, chloroplastic [Cryptomeria japonica]
MIMEAIFPCSPKSCFYNAPKFSPLPSHPRRLVACNVQTEAKPPATTPTDKPTSPSRSPGSAEDSTPLKPLNVQSFSSLNSSDLQSPRPLTALVCNAIDDFINNFIDKPLRPSVDPRFVLAGNFAPVKETAPTECVNVQGTLPPCLDGVYIRNGPNPRYVPRAGHHLFDGDGMLHALRIKGNHATFCSRFVRTYKYAQEDIAGGPVMPNVFSGFYSFAGVARGALIAARVAMGLFNPFNGGGLANTSLLHFDNKLMSLGESDLPYVVRVTDSGDVETVGRYDFDGKLFMGMTAHPKLDPETGELFAFRYGPVPPFLNYFRVAPNGEKEPDVGILSMLQPSFIHDFAITGKYAIFPDTQIVVKPLDMILGSGSPIGCDTGKVPRLGILPRYATNDTEMKWVEVPGLNFFHSLNAWDEGDEIVLIAANSYPVEHILERTHLVHSTVEKVRINLSSGIVVRTPLSSKCLEFGVINGRFLAKKNRFAYMSIGAPLPKISGIVKLDFEKEEMSDVKECVVASRLYGPGWFGSEPFFVPRSEEDLNAEEDDGYVVAYTHHESTGESRFVVMDARSPTLDIVASVELPARVPYGFHGLFVSDRELSSSRY